MNEIQGRAPLKDSTQNNSHKCGAHRDIFNCFQNRTVMHATDDLSPPKVKRIKIDASKENVCPREKMALAEKEVCLKRKHDNEVAGLLEKFKKISTDDVDDKCPPLEHVGAYVMMFEHYSECWESLAKGLGFSDDLIKKIDDSNSLLFGDSCFMRMSTVLSAWFFETERENLKPFKPFVLKEAVADLDIKQVDKSLILQRIDGFNAPRSKTS